MISCIFMLIGSKMIFQDCGFHWVQKFSYFKELPIFTIWEVSKAHNKLIFEGSKPSLYIVGTRSISSFFEFFKEKGSLMKVEGIAYGFFYGASQNGMCGDGMVLRINRDHCLHL